MTARRLQPGTKPAGLFLFGWLVFTMKGAITFNVYHPASLFAQAPCLSLSMALARDSNPALVLGFFFAQWVIVQGSPQGEGLASDIFKNSSQ
jgi:hypothetical protein